MKSSRVQISVPSSGTGFKSEAAWTAEALGAQWSRRRGYTVASRNRAEQFAALVAGDFEASRRFFASDKRPYYFEHASRPGEKLTLRQALDLAKELSAVST